MNRSKEQRQAEVRPIIVKLNELHLSPTQHEEIKLLFKEIQRYIQDGVRIELNIPFDAYNTTIEGVLAIRLKERVWVKFAAKM
jgi:hypothetical protein